MREVVERAKELARRAHAGQVEKAGRPYIEHVARVAAAVSDDPEAEAVAWLHDVLEDAPQEMQNWLGHHLEDNFCGVVVDAVIDLTRFPDYPTDAYYADIRSNPLALRVKLADIADNASENRLALLDEKTAARLRRKYAKALEALKGGEDERG
ncbi:Bifunctional (p)ppGpp synthase/hydrolase SpoT [compost metagenome]